MYGIRNIFLAFHGNWKQQQLPEHDLSAYISDRLTSEITLFSLHFLHFEKWIAMLFMHGRHTFNSRNQARSTPNDFFEWKNNQKFFKFNFRKIFWNAIFCCIPKCSRNCKASMKRRFFIAIIFIIQLCNFDEIKTKTDSSWCFTLIWSFLLNNTVWRRTRSMWKMMFSWKKSEVNSCEMQCYSLRYIRVMLTCCHANFLLNSHALNMWSHTNFNVHVHALGSCALHTFKAYEFNVKWAW